MSQGPSGQRYSFRHAPGPSPLAGRTSIVETGRHLMAMTVEQTEEVLTAYAQALLSHGDYGR